MILPHDRPNTQVGKWLVFLAGLSFSIMLTHWAIKTDGSFYGECAAMLVVSGVSFRIARHLE